MTRRQSMKFHADSRTYTFTEDLDFIKEEEVYDVHSAHYSGGTGYRKYIEDRSQRRKHSRPLLEGETHSNEESKEGGDKEYVRDRLADGEYRFEELEALRGDMLYGKDHKSNRLASIFKKLSGFIFT